MPWAPLRVSHMCVPHPMETATGKKTCSLPTTRHLCRCCVKIFTLLPDDVSLHAAVEGDDVGLHPRVKNANLFQGNLFHQVAQVGIVELHVRLVSYGVNVWVNCVKCLGVMHPKKRHTVSRVKCCACYASTNNKHAELRRVLLCYEPKNKTKNEPKNSNKLEPKNNTKNTRKRIVVNTARPDLILE